MNLVSAYPIEYILKINATYGKFAQSPERTTMHFTTQELKTIRDCLSVALVKNPSLVARVNLAIAKQEVAALTKPAKPSKENK